MAATFNAPMNFSAALLPRHGLHDLGRFAAADQRADETRLVGRSIRKDQYLVDVGDAASGLGVELGDIADALREKAKEEEESSDGKSGKKRAKFTGLPVLSQIDEMDYADFLNEVSDKNKQKFYSWLDSIKSREQSISAMKIFETWQESVCDLRIALVQMAKYGKFKEEIKK